MAQQTAVDIMFEKAISVLPLEFFYSKVILKETYQQAKEMEKQQEQNALKIIEAQNQYIALLCKEIDSAVSIAHVHGWRSNLVEEGKNMRNKITRLQNETN